MGSQASLVAIRGAFIALVVETGYDQMTVQALADRAKVSRSTFYSHYDGKDDLLRALLGQLHQAVASHWKAFIRGGGCMGELAFLRPLIFHLEESRELWQALRNSSARPILLPGFKVMLADLVSQDQGFDQPLNAEQATVVSCVTGAFLEMMDRWLRGVIPGSKETIARQFELAARAVASQRSAG